MKSFAYLFIIGISVILVSSCEKDNKSSEVTTIPTIENFFASRDTIEFGGDTATLTILASGGNLQYIWDVDLGDLLPLDDGHKALFSGSECCVGMKDIKCTVSNDKGEVEAVVNVFIKEPK